MHSSRLGQVPRLARNLISRLLDQSAAVTTGEQPIGPVHNPLGMVTFVSWQMGCVTIHGRHAGDRLSLAIDGQPEQDFCNATFEITLPRLQSDARLRITCSTASVSETLYLAPPDVREMRSARRQVLPKVLWRLIEERRGIVSYLRTGDPNVALGIRQRLGLTDREEGTYVPSNLFATSVVPMPKQPPVIILPVFNAFSDLDRVLRRFPDNVGCEHHLVIVDDFSDDPLVAKRLDEFASQNPQSCTLVRQPQNLGFVAAVNAGIELAQGLSAGDVILLNTDTVPPQDWVPRLLAPISRDQSVASVTPMSNAAEILSIPKRGGAALPSPDAIDRIDEVAQSLAAETAAADVPTGIGFCMAINRRFLDRIGPFDPAFGRGYGEEVDWCQRASKIGGRHVALASLFVGHRGGGSFEKEEKAQRIQTASAEISRRYPNYDAAVQTWSASDPLAAQRLALTIAWLGSESDQVIPVYFGHSLGGGAETALMAEVADAMEKGCPGVVILRVGGPRSWRIEVRTKDSSQMGEVLDQSQLMRLLSPLRHRKVIYSCGVGAGEPASVPRFLLRLIQMGTPFELRLHDFFPISPSWNLLDNTGRFSGVPDLNTRDPVHRVDGRNPLIHRDWRLLWRAVLCRAQVITCYSQPSADLLVAAYPDVRDRIVLQPHRLSFTPDPVPPGGQNVGVLGSINRPKGAEVVSALGAFMRHRRLFVIGQMDGRYHLDAPHAVHGSYAPSEISDLAMRYDIGIWIMPSICPETFSFTTHEALATGLPVLGFDLGAQAEALRRAPEGHVLPYRPDDTAALASKIEELLSGQSEIRLRSAS